MDDLVAGVQHFEMGNVESRDRLQRQLEHLIAFPAIGWRQLLPGLPERPQDTCAIESLPFAVLAITHCLFTLSLIGGAPCTPPGSLRSARSSPLAPFRSLLNRWIQCTYRSRLITGPAPLRQVKRQRSSAGRVRRAPGGSRRGTCRPPAHARIDDAERTILQQVCRKRLRRLVALGRETGAKPAGPTQVVKIGAEVGQVVVEGHRVVGIPISASCTDLVEADLRLRRRELEPAYQAPRSGPLNGRPADGMGKAALTTAASGTAASNSSGPMPRHLASLGEQPFVGRVVELEDSLRCSSSSATRMSTLSPPAGAATESADGCRAAEGRDRRIRITRRAVRRAGGGR